MAMKQTKEKHISVRVPNGTHSSITIYAKANGLTLTQAIEELLEEGLRCKNEPLATRKDIERLITETENLKLQNETTRAVIVKAIENQPIAVQRQLDESKEIKKSWWKRVFRGDEQ